MFSFTVTGDIHWQRSILDMSSWNSKIKPLKTVTQAYLCSANLGVVFVNENDSTTTTVISVDPLSGKIFDRVKVNYSIRSVYQVPYTDIHHNRILVLVDQLDQVCCLFSLFFLYRMNSVTHKSLLCHYGVVCSFDKVHSFPFSDDAQAAFSKERRHIFFHNTLVLVFSPLISFVTWHVALHSSFLVVLERHTDWRRQDSRLWYSS